MKLTLQNLCISSIVESIDRYNHVYSTTDNKVLQQGFQILQKVYSEKLLEQLIDKELLKEEHAVLVFNKHLKSINTHMFSSFSWESIVETFSRIGPDLEEVSIPDCYPNTNRPWKDVICYLRNIKSISYVMTCNDSILECIAKYCPILEELYVAYSRNVSNDGLIQFCSRKMDKKEGLVSYVAEKASFCRRSVKEEPPCPLLKEIHIDYTTVRDDGIKKLLESWPSLEILSHPRLPFILYTMHKDNLNSPRKIQPYNLTHLDLISAARDCRDLYDDILKVSVSMCPNLKRLSCRIFKSEHLKSCFTLDNLEVLTLDCDKDSRLDVSYFLKQNGGKLTSLTLHRCAVSLSVLEQYCNHLKHLDMFKVDIQYDEKESSSVFDRLRTFSVNHIGLSNSSNIKGICSIMESCRVLKRLNIDSCDSYPSEIMVEILKCCEKCPVKYIDLTVPFVESKIIKSILETCSTLKFMHLLFCPNDDADEIEEALRSFATNLPHRPELDVAFRPYRLCTMCWKNF